MRRVTVIMCKSQDLTLQNRVSENSSLAVSCGTTSVYLQVARNSCLRDPLILRFDYPVTFARRLFQPRPVRARDVAPPVVNLPVGLEVDGRLGLPWPAGASAKARQQSLNGSHVMSRSRGLEVSPQLFESR